MASPSPQEQLNATLTEAIRAAENQPVTPEEISQTLGQVYYLIKDEQVLAQMTDDPDLMVLLPAVSHLVRTGRTDIHSIREAKLHWRRACRLQLMVKKKPSLANLAKFDSWKIFGDGALEDKLEGWRGKLVTERIKTYKIEGNQQRKKWLGLF